MRSPRCLLAAWCLAAVWFHAAGFPAGNPLVADEPAVWKAGVASDVVTPAEPMWMAGYASRNRPSEGTAQDLFIKALALQSPEGQKLVIVTSDLISVPRPIRDELERIVGEKFQLPPAALLMNCSHTHCGPEFRASRWKADALPADRLAANDRYVALLVEKLERLVGDALQRLEPARLSYCHARCGFAMNRRTPGPDGFRNFPNPDGPVDHDVPVLKVADAAGKLRAVLFGYACHNTTLSFYQFCGDYAGYAQQYFQEAHPETTALFLLGCGGDQNPYPRGTLDLAQQHGRTLATAVDAALATEARPIQGPLRVAYDLVTVAYQTPPTRDELEQRAQSKDNYERRYAQRLLEQLTNEGKLRTEYACPVQVVRFGDSLTLIGLPGETVVDYSLRLKQELAAANGPAVWVAGYCNDVFAYIPSRRVLLEGGYEAGGAMRYMSLLLQPGPFAPDIEERILAKVHELQTR